MLEKSKLFFSPLASLLFLIIGSSFFMTFITVHLQTKGAGEWAIGSMHSFFYGGMFLGAFIIERGIRQIGHIRVFAVTASMTCASMLTMALNDDLWVWQGSRFVAGFCMAAQFVTIESWLLVLSSVLDRGRILAIYMISFYTAQALSQYIINVVDLNSAQPYIISALFVSFSVIPVTTTSRPQPHVPEKSKFGLITLFKIAPFGFIGCFMSGMLISCIYGFTPAFAVDKGLPVARLMAATIFGGVLLQWPFGKASDLFNRRAILLLLSALLIVPSLLVLTFLGDVKITLILSFVLGGIIYTLYPLSLSQVCDRVGHNDLVGVTSLLLIVYGIGSMLGPITAPLIIVPFGFQGLFIYYAVIGAIMTVVGLITLLLYRPTKLVQQEYEPLMPVTSVAYELDPRKDE